MKIFVRISSIPEKIVNNKINKSSKQDRSHIDKEIPRRRMEKQGIAKHTDRNQPNRRIFEYNRGKLERSGYKRDKTDRSRD